ncbi:MAG: AAA family ATPase [Bacteroidaceae bacterium]|nr:AAA family ATPase [Bacteroidaceae bacterium]
MTKSNENIELEMARNYVLYTRRNIFLTGRAGTGKTTFLRRLHEETRKRMVVVAPTGVAAINAGGMTIHSFFQLAPGLFLPNGQMMAGREPQNRFSFSKHKVNILRSLDLLVIDEISMVRADLLDAIDQVLRRYGKRNEPFGGVQLLLIGDLQQLAPVATDSEWDILRQFYSSPFFFSSLALLQTDLVCIELKKVYRQDNPLFISLLNDVRDGHPSASTINTLNSRYQPAFQPPANEDWITLTTHNALASRINEQEMGKLPSQPVTFTAKVSGEFPESSYPTDMQLFLKEGAQVMFCKNDPSENKAFFNGKIGTVKSIDNDKVKVVCKRGDVMEQIEVEPLSWINTKYITDSETGEIKQEDVGSFTQIPLRTAWAITIHKSQGLTFDHAVIDAGRAFSHGQVYVALSRCRSLEGLVLSTQISSTVISSDPEVEQFNEYADQHVPTVESLIRDRRSFVEDILCDIFDFQALSMRLRHYVRLVQEYAARFFPSYAQAAAAAAIQLDSQLMAVGVKFQQQIHQLMPLAESYSRNTQLRDRVQKGMAYYVKQTAAILGELLEMDVPAVDNKVHAEQLQREFDFLKSDYQLKMDIFTACVAQFSLDAFWNAKARAAMTEDTAPRRRSSTTRTAKRTTSKGDSTKRRTAKDKANEQSLDKPTADKQPAAEITDIQNPAIYKAIINWRNSVAKEKKLPASYILPLRTVIALANQRPSTPEALLAIPGIGKKTKEQYGAELLEIVRG